MGRGRGIHGYERKKNRQRRGALGSVCKKCKGTGKVNRRVEVPGSFFGGKETEVRTCDKCQGRGRR